MTDPERFFDTNVLLYLLSADEERADRAERELLSGGVISVQVLNEFASVATRRLALSIDETREALAAIRAVCRVEPVTEDTHDKAMELAARHRLSVYDATIVASALRAGCRTLVSEDLQHGQVFDGSLRVRNPFR
jgi:predicted nucleic acid-binding protein